MANEDRLWNEAFYAAAREVGSALTPEELVLRRVRRVRYVPRASLRALLERTVEKALAEQARGQRDVSEVVDDVQQGFLALLRGAQQVEHARHAVHAQREALEDELAHVTSTRGLPATAENALRERDLAIDRLERRVRKLVEALTASEEALQRSMAAHSFDDGLASLYRVVQGLSPTDPEAARKREMMGELFRANLALRSSREAAG